MSFCRFTYPALVLLWLGVACGHNSAGPVAAQLGSSVGGAASSDTGRPLLASDSGVDGGPDAASLSLDASKTVVDDLSARAERIREKYKLPSLAVAVFRSSGMMAVGAAGVRKVGDATPVTTQDKWHLGSNTKAMTATLIARLVDQHKVRWGTTLAEAYPKLALHPGYQAVTLEQLLAHRGGVPGSPAGMTTALFKNWSESQAPRAAAVSKVLAEPPFSTNRSWTYSNAGYMASVSWLETAEDPWEKQIAREVFEPLGMSECGFAMPATVGLIDQPWGHETPAVAGGSYEPVPQGKYADNPRGMGPSGRVHCTLASWGKFLSANLGAGRGDTRYLSAASFKQLSRAKPAVAGGDRDDYALGWSVVSRSWSNGDALVHNGSNKMNMSVAWVAPGIDRAFAAVSNAGSDDAATAEDELIVELIGVYGK